MKTGSKSLLIGDLLVNSGLVSTKALEQAVPMARKMRLPIGRILVSNGALSEMDLQAALHAQSLIRDLLLTPDLAVQALPLVRKSGGNLEDALKKLGWSSEYFEMTNRLGQLLNLAGLIDDEELAQCLNACFNSGLQLGRILVLRGKLTPLLAYAALTAQLLIRDGKITLTQAIQALKMAASGHKTIEDSLNLSGLQVIETGNTIRLGELLVLAELVSELELLTGIERGLVEEKAIGEILVEAEIINAKTLQNALNLQSMVMEGKIKPLQAANTLKLATKKNISVNEALNRVTGANRAMTEQVTLAELLKMTAIVEPEDVDKAAAYAKSHKVSLERALIENHWADREVIDTVQRCHFLINIGNITVEQAVFSLHVWYWSGATFEDTLRTLNWPIAAL